MEAVGGGKCVAMFSGGRDSTVAALRLGRAGWRQILTTVSSPHLVGLAAVKTRLRELAPHMSPATIWLNVKQPSAKAEDEFLVHPTCFPCHKAYVSIAVAVALQERAEAVSFGYAGYQADWPEQTPAAVEYLRDVLRRHDLTLLTPAYSLQSKDEAIAELHEYGISAAALEQKCLQQINNRPLSPSEYKAELTRWQKAVAAALERRDEAEVLERATIGHVLAG